MSSHLSNAALYVAVLLGSPGMALWAVAMPPRAAQTDPAPTQVETATKPVQVAQPAPSPLNTLRPAARRQFAGCLLLGVHPIMALWPVEPWLETPADHPPTANPTYNLLHFEHLIDATEPSSPRRVRVCKTPELTEEDLEGVESRVNAALARVLAEGVEVEVTTAAKPADADAKADEQPKGSVCIDVDVTATGLRWMWQLQTGEKTYKVRYDNGTWEVSTPSAK